MWDQKTGINVSAPEGSDRIIGSGGSNNQSISDKKVFESTGEDSGFISSQNIILLSSDSVSDSHLDAVSNKEFEDLRDSGAILSEEYIDDDRQDYTKDKKQEQPMILQNVVDSGVTEWFCGLNLKDSSLPLNDLGSKSAPESPEELSKTSLMRICYTQDADGDT